MTKMPPWQKRSYCSVLLMFSFERSQVRRKRLLHWACRALSLGLWETSGQSPNFVNVQGVQESIPKNRDSKESIPLGWEWIPGLLERLQIRALATG